VDFSLIEFSLRQTHHTPNCEEKDNGENGIDSRLVR